MVDFEEVFGDKKPEKRHDDVKELINLMNKYSNEKNYEMAKHVLDKIGMLLEPKEHGKDISVFLEFTDIQTLEDINRMLLSNSIRLNVKHYYLSDWLNLLLSLDKRKSELQGMKYTDINRQRKVVAEEMLCLEMIVPKKEYRVGRMPNRAFLDILYSVHPELCRQELGRREQVKLWKAIESGDVDKIEEVRREVGKYSNG